jgi:hypothetical protein
VYTYHTIPYHTMLAVRAVPSEVFGVPGAVAVVGSSGPNVAWAIDAATGRKLPFSKTTTMKTIVSAQRNAGPVTIKARLANDATKLPPADLPVWAAAIEADICHGIPHGVTGREWATAAQAARVLDYSLMDPTHDTEAERYIVPASSVAALASQLGAPSLVRTVDPRFCDMCCC